MKLLIIGGTIFVGRHLVENALARGHEVTLFNRGQHNADLFPEVEKLRGNRDGELDVLRGRTWDAVIDTCGYVPRIVRASAQLLSDATDRYVFISSISAYSDFSQPGMDESGPLGTTDDSTNEKVTNESYGPLKVLCEQAAEEAFPGRAVIIRPGMIVGPYDPTDRFTYWYLRAARGGEVLAVAPPDAPVQWIDGRDLAEWTIRLLETRQTGAYNAIGPYPAIEQDKFLNECRAATGVSAHFTYVPESFLTETAEAQGQEPPPLFSLSTEGEPAFAHIFNVSNARAVASGLTFRPLAETVRDTLAWAATRPADYIPRGVITSEQERELLTAWHNRQQP